MDWSIFLTLAGLLLPLALGLRLFFNLVWAAAPLGRSDQAFRAIVLLLLAIPISAKLPTLIFAVLGRYGDVAALTLSFIVTPWGIAHLVITLLAVLAIDLWEGRILHRLTEGLPHQLPAAANLRRDAGILFVCLCLAWAAAR